VSAAITAMMSGDLHHVEQGCDARHDVLADGRGRRNHRVVAAGKRDDEVCHRLGQPVGVFVAFGMKHLGTPSSLAASSAAPSWQPCRQPECGRRRRSGGGQRLGGLVGQRSVVVFGYEENGHVRSSFPLTFVLQLVDQFGTEPTLTPALRPAARWS
jgi:hypothetical protein